MKKGVLVIDDDYPIRLLIQKVLEKEDLVHVFNNVAKAVEHMNSNGNPDVIITDIKLPVIDGKDFLRHLKTSAKYGAIPIVIMSSWIDDQTQQDCHMAGAAAYIKKPFNPEVVVKILEQVVNKVDNQEFLVG